MKEDGMKGISYHSFSLSFIILFIHSFIHSSTHLFRSSFTLLLPTFTHRLSSFITPLLFYSHIHILLPHLYSHTRSFPFSCFLFSPEGRHDGPLVFGKGVCGGAGQLTHGPHHASALVQATDHLEVLLVSAHGHHALRPALAHPL